MSDKEQAFNKWFGDLPDRGDDALFRGWSRSGFNAGYQAALTHSAEKDAEIERLKDIGNTLASSLHVASDEIARLQRVVGIAKEFVESPDIHEPIADNGMTVADGFIKAFKNALAAEKEPK